jgi:hypothetical protein
VSNGVSRMARRAKRRWSKGGVIYFRHTALTLL